MSGSWSDGANRWALGSSRSNLDSGFLPQDRQMAQAHDLTVTVIAGYFLLADAALRCVAATFNRNDEFIIPCLLGGKHINLRNIQGKADFGRGRYGHCFHSVFENDFHSTSPPHMCVPLVFPKNQSYVY